MLLYETMLKKARVIFREEPEFDTKTQSFRVEGELVDMPAKWAGYPTPVIVRGGYDPSSAHKLIKGASVTVDGGYNSASQLGDFGYIHVHAIEPSPANIRLASLPALSSMRIDADEHSRDATDLFMGWERKLNQQDIWLDRVVSQFLCANPQHFSPPAESEDPRSNPWVELSNAINKAHDENPYTSMRQWIAPRPMVEALIGRALCAALFDHAAQQGMEVVERRPNEPVRRLRALSGLSPER